MRELDDAGESRLVGVCDVLGEPPALRREVRGAAGGGVEDERRHALRMVVRRVDGDRAADAAAEQVRALDLECVEQVDALHGVVVPSEPLDAAAGLTRLALVEDDALELRRQLVDQAQPLVDRERPPVLELRVEAAGREAEERRPFAAQLVAGDDPVAERGRHQSPCAGRAPRTSARYVASGSPSKRWIARIRPSSQGPPPSPPSTGIDTADTAAAPASGPECRKSMSAAPASSMRFASFASSICAHTGMPAAASSSAFDSTLTRSAPSSSTRRAAASDA